MLKPEDSDCWNESTSSRRRKKWTARCHKRRPNPVDKIQLRKYIKLGYKRELEQERKETVASSKTYILQGDLGYNFNMYRHLTASQRRPAIYIDREILMQVHWPTCVSGVSIALSLDRNLEASRPTTITKNISMSLGSAKPGLFCQPVLWLLIFACKILPSRCALPQLEANFRKFETRHTHAISTWHWETYAAGPSQMWPVLIHKKHKVKDTLSDYLREKNFHFSFLLNFVSLLYCKKI